VATKKGMTAKFFSSLSFVAVFGSGIRDLGSGTWNPGPGTRIPVSGMGKIRIRDTGIKIPDQQHCFFILSMSSTY
jgi:hypothetical protein